MMVFFISFFLFFFKYKFSSGSGTGTLFSWADYFVNSSSCGFKKEFVLMNTMRVATDDLASSPTHDGFNTYSFILLDSSLDPTLIQPLAFFGDLQTKVTYSSRHTQLSANLSKTATLRKLLLSSNALNSNLIFIAHHAPTCVFTAAGRNRLRNLCTRGYWHDGSAQQSASGYQKRSNRLWLRYNSHKDVFSNDSYTHFNSTQIMSSLPAGSPSVSFNSLPRRNIYGLINGHWHTTAMETIRSTSPPSYGSASTHKTRVYAENELASFVANRIWRLYYIDHGVVGWVDNWYTVNRGVFNYAGYQEAISSAKQIFNSSLQLSSSPTQEKTRKRSTDSHALINVSTIPLLENAVKPITTFLQNEHTRLLYENERIQKRDAKRQLTTWGLKKVVVDKVNKRNTLTTTPSTVTVSRTPFSDVFEFINNHFRVHDQPGHERIYEEIDERANAESELQSLFSSALNSTINSPAKTPISLSSHPYSNTSLSDSIKQLYESLRPSYPSSFRFSPHSSLSSLSPASVSSSSGSSLCHAVVMNPPNVQQITVRQPFHLVQNSTHIRALVFCQKRVVNVWAVIDEKKGKGSGSSSASTKVFNLTQSEQAHKMGIPLFTAPWNASQFKSKHLHTISLHVEVNESLQSNISDTSFIRPDGKGIVGNISASSPAFMEHNSFYNNLQDSSQTLSASTSLVRFDFNSTEFSVTGHTSIFGPSIARAILELPVATLFVTVITFLSVVLIIHILISIFLPCLGYLLGRWIHQYQKEILSNQLSITETSSSESASSHSFSRTLHTSSGSSAESTVSIACDASSNEHNETTSPNIISESSSTSSPDHLNTADNSQDNVTDLILDNASDISWRTCVSFVVVPDDTHKKEVQRALTMDTETLSSTSYNSCIRCSSCCCIPSCIPDEVWLLPYPIVKKIEEWKNNVNLYYEIKKEIRCRTLLSENDISNNSSESLEQLDKTDTKSSTSNSNEENVNEKGTSSSF